jgi:hypothetical protein
MIYSDTMEDSLPYCQKAFYVYFYYCFLVFIRSLGQDYLAI